MPPGWVQLVHNYTRRGGNGVKVCVEDVGNGMCMCASVGTESVYTCIINFFSPSCLVHFLVVGLLCKLCLLMELQDWSV